MSLELNVLAAGLAAGCHSLLSVRLKLLQLLSPLSKCLRSCCRSEAVSEGHQVTAVLVKELMSGKRIESPG